MNNQPPVEIRYLKIQWNSAQQAIKLELSSGQPQEINLKDDGSHFVETHAFVGVNIYIGFKLLQNITHIPYINLKDQQQKLIPIKAPASNEIWWIQASQWDDKKHRYLSDLQRVTGRVSLTFNSQSLFLHNNTHEFSVEELEYYLSDFKRSLWFLILDNNSVAKLNTQKEKGRCLDSELLHLYSELIKNTEDITRSPHMFLSECQNKKPKRVVKPVTKTFREITTNPNTKTLTSRDFYESYDTPENRYIHHCLKKAKLLLDVFFRITEKQSEQLQQQIEQADRVIQYCNTVQYKKIDKDVYNQEIQTMEQKLSNFTNIINFMRQHPPISPNIYAGLWSAISIQLNNPTDHFKGFFISKFNDLNLKEYKINFAVISFPQEILNHIQQHRLNLTGYTLEMMGEFYVVRKTSKNKQDYWQILISKIDNINIKELKNKIQTQKDNIAKYEENNWRVPLTKQEKDDFQKERITAEQKKKLVFSTKCHSFRGAKKIAHSKTKNQSTT